MLLRVCVVTDRHLLDWVLFRGRGAEVHRVQAGETGRGERGPRGHRGDGYDGKAEIAASPNSPHFLGPPGESKTVTVVDSPHRPDLPSTQPPTRRTP